MQLVNLDLELICEFAAKLCRQLRLGLNPVRASISMAIYTHLRCHLKCLFEWHFQPGNLNPDT